MTTDKITRISSLMEAAGRRNVPVPIEEWRQMQIALMEKQECLGTGGNALVAGCASGTRGGTTKAETNGGAGAAVCGSTPGRSRIVARNRGRLNDEAGEMATRIGKATVKDGKVRPVVKRTASQRAAGNKKAARAEKAWKAASKTSRTGTPGTAVTAKANSAKSRRAGK